MAAADQNQDLSVVGPLATKNGALLLQFRAVVQSVPLTGRKLRNKAGSTLRAFAYILGATRQLREIYRRCLARRSGRH